MRGVVYLGESEVEVRDFPDPEPGPGQVVIEMRVGGLCGSDLHKYHSSREWAVRREGMISGHEPAGVVAEIGAAVDNVVVGDRVCIYHRTGCGQCADCVSGYAASCSEGGAFGRTRDGSHADYMLTEARYCMKLPPALSFAAGTQLACTAGTAYSAVSKVEARPDDRIVVFGLGPVGLTTLLLARAIGYDAIGVEVHPYRVEFARLLSDGLIIDAGIDATQAIADLRAEVGVKAVLECSGSAWARRQSTSIAGRGAVVVYVGGGNPELSVEIGDVIGKDLCLRGSSVYTMRQYYEAAQLLTERGLSLDALVTHRYPLEQAPEAFRLFDSGESGKVIFDWT
ncbi:MAG: alcohol dehydrogenase catalytic domain-containing protein [Candidatus Latescibacterota bacterium]|nr:alcohol dehydrogenase catalytic domain-containing protein [Candidatus Latescibacterota bacterium]